MGIIVNRKKFDYLDLTDGGRLADFVHTQRTERDIDLRTGVRC